MANDDLAAALEAILPEAFAVCREAARRVLAMRHFDVQLIGGMVLHEGKIAEMATGEGKTLVATLPAYLNALLRARGRTSSRSTTTWPSATPSGWGRSIMRWGSAWASSSTRPPILFDPTARTSDPRLANLRPCTRQEAYTAPTSPTGPTANSASTICATT